MVFIKSKEIYTDLLVNWMLSFWSSLIYLGASHSESLLWYGMVFGIWIFVKPLGFWYLEGDMKGEILSERLGHLLDPGAQVYSKLLEGYIDLWDFLYPRFILKCLIWLGMKILYFKLKMNSCICSEFAVLKFRYLIDDLKSIS